MLRGRWRRERGAGGGGPPPSVGPWPAASQESCPACPSSGPSWPSPWGPSLGQLRPESPGGHRGKGTFRSARTATAPPGGRGSRRGSPRVSAAECHVSRPVTCGTAPAAPGRPRASRAPPWVGGGRPPRHSWGFSSGPASRGWTASSFFTFGGHSWGSPGVAPGPRAWLLPSPLSWEASPGRWL